MDIKKLYKSFENCVCGRNHICPTENVIIEKDAINTVDEYCDSYNRILLVSDNNTSKYAEQILNIIGD